MGRRAMPQTKLPRPSGPNRPSSLIASCYGTSQTCRGYRENFSLPGCGAAPHAFQTTNYPIFLKRFVSFVSFVIYKYSGNQRAPARQNLHQSATSAFLHSGSPACGSTPLICSKSAKSAVPHAGSLCDLCGPSVSLRVPRSVRPHRRRRRQAGAQPPGLLQASNLPSFQTSFPLRKVA